MVQSADFTSCPSTSRESESMAVGSLDIVNDTDPYPIPTPAHLYQDQTASTSEAPPCSLLPGEGVHRFSRLDTGGGVWLTNYRLFVLLGSHQGFYNITFGSIDTIEYRDSTLVILCKDATAVRIPGEHAIHWHNALLPSIAGVRKADDYIFAYRFFAYRDKQPEHFDHTDYKLDQTPARLHDSSITVCEFKRLHFDERRWRVTDANSKYALCDSYPRHLIVPASTNDAQLAQSAKFRNLKRLPVCVYNYRANNVVLMRSAQPACGLLNWRCEEDERILQTAFECMEKAKSVDHVDLLGECVNGVGMGKMLKKMLIMDARSYTSAWGNKWAKGGGYENTEFYAGCEVQFMGLANIHNIRTSFQQLRSALLSASSENYLTSLHSSMWFTYLSQLLGAAVRAVSAMHDDSRSVLVHCSDGWDRTTQIVSLTKLLIDPYYRTIDGFTHLVELDWVQFGHKFADRNAVLNGDVNERAPVFLQWLDAVHQILEQYPTAFEFNRVFLAKLAEHTYSCLFGTFTCNSLKEMEQLAVDRKTLSVWSLLHKDNEHVRNQLYDQCDTILWPKTSILNLRFWHDVYVEPSWPVGASHLASLQQQQQAMVTSVNGLVVDAKLTRAHSAESLKDIECTDANANFATPGSSLNRTGSDTQLYVHCNAGINTTNGLVDSTMDHSIHLHVNTNDDSASFVLPIDHASITPKAQVNGEDMPDFGCRKMTNGSNDMLFALSEDDAYPPSLTNLNEHDIKTNGINNDMVSSTSEISDSRATCRCMLESAINSEPINGVFGNSSTLSELYAPLRRSPSATSLRSQTIARLIDVDGLVRRAHEQEKLLNLKNFYESRILQLEREVSKYKIISEKQRPVVACTKCRVNDDFEEQTQLPKSHVKAIERAPAGARATGSGSDSSDWESLAKDSRSPQVKWWPDDQISNCMKCDTRFSHLLRKHHCRNCGKIFCASCSAFECVISSLQYYRPVRVCRDCHRRLTDIPDGRQRCEKQNGLRDKTGSQPRLKAS